jgi:UDP-GlcNAc:undecaprenyl-phosphate GlcNAc-1-phosphate transferase
MDLFNPGVAALFLAALAAAWLATPLARRAALRLGWVDRPGARKIHAEPTPYGGGLAIYLTVTGLAAACWAGAAWLTGGGWAPAFLAERMETLRPYLEGLGTPAALRTGFILAVGGTAMFALGLWDDARPLSPRAKLLCQFPFACLPAALGLRMEALSDWPLPAAVATALWIVVVTNAFNLLDNMDGLCAGVAAIAAALFGVVALEHGQYFVAGFLALLAGAAAGFLRWNFAPAKLFLGDAGALLLGYWLAVMTVCTTFYAGRGGVYAVATPVLILGVPLFDTATVMWIRWRNGQSIFKGDKIHLSHRLTRMGFGRRGAVMIIWLLGLILGAAATLLPQLEPRGAAVILLIGFGVIALTALLMTATKTPE